MCCCAVWCVCALVYKNNYDCRMCWCICITVYIYVNAVESASCRVAVSLIYTFSQNSTILSVYRTPYSKKYIIDKEFKNVIFPFTRSIKFITENS